MKLKVFNVREEEATLAQDWANRNLMWNFL